ncbi:hypothetical protein D9Q98_003890 [Chlorella vulgaris]|uniref:Exostosin GT47 domain-containing protein n=1 Tax=Chlorella vulgaris TaxID=3077 RepID=A0A9D4TR86_CHLVU|nr:hypothetical protein D9Q98_003890 [Chlorella vulgaris]
MEDGDRPWLKPFVHTPAAWDPPLPTRKRPFIYVYELPPIYNAVLLSYRTEKAHCVAYMRCCCRASTGHWTQVRLIISTFLYTHAVLSTQLHLQLISRTSMEVPLLRGLRQLPICFLRCSIGSARITPGGIEVVDETTSFRAHAMVQPTLVLPSPCPTHRHPVWQLEGHVLSRLGAFPCYDPRKDLTVPLMWSPNKYGLSPLLGAPTRERHILAFFKGRVMEDKPAYSRGTRQFLAKMTRNDDWWGKYRIHVVEAMPKGNISESTSYSEALVSSVFCFSLMGEGWGSRYDEAVLHGCKPVLIHDEVEPSWNTILAVETYSVRNAHKDMKRYQKYLRGFSEEEIARMQANVA